MKLAERKREGTRYPIAHSELSQIPSPLPSSLRQQKIFRFDIDAYPFREAVAEVLGINPEMFPVLHTTPEAAGKRLHVRSGKEAVFLKKWNSMKGSDAYRRFTSLLHSFVDGFVSTRMCADGCEEGFAVPVAYQRDVTFRVHDPSDDPMGVPHTDAEYNHPPSEVNWWLPLTPVWGSNTLHVESEPGSGDHAPVELGYGEVLRFYGNLCHHYTLPNQTDKCRVSFDFRVLQLSCHDPEWVDYSGHRCKFTVGRYYIPAGPCHPPSGLCPELHKTGAQTCEAGQGGKCREDESQDGDNKRSEH